MKFAYAFAKKFEQADIILFGVKDDSKSYAKKSGASKGPDAIRKASNQKDVFYRRKEKIFEAAEDHELKKKMFDAGNIKKKDVAKFVEKIIENGKLPLCLGGDHSITYEAIKGVSSKMKDISIIYFDAHPDFVTSEHNYHGSVIGDAIKLKGVNKKAIVEVGIRAPEPEELRNIKKSHIKSIAAFDIVEKGVKKVLAEIKKTAGKNVYLSIDLDVVDPAFAPGVDVPCPGGLTSNQLIYFFKNLIDLNLVGIDIMEVSPKNDIDQMTADLASKLIIEYL